MHDAFKEQARAKWVSADLLRALVGFWLFAALLRREALAILYALSDFIADYEGQWARPSKQV